jgi:hypothetical protein
LLAYLVDYSCFLLKEATLENLPMTEEIIRRLSLRLFRIRRYRNFIEATKPVICT